MKKLTFLVIISLLANILAGTIFISASATAVKPTDYIAAFDFETLTSSKITDLSGNNYHGVIRKPANMTIVDAVGMDSSKALQNTAATDTQMNAAGLGNVIKAKSALSISGWFKRSAINANEQYLFNIPNTAGFTGLAASVLTTGKMKFQVRNTAASANLKDVTTTTTTHSVAGTWKHYTFTIELPATSAGTGKLAIYTDGVKEIENTAVDVQGMTTLSTLGYTDPATDFRFGGQGSGAFVGLMDDVRVFDRILTQDEINALANVPEAAPVPDPVLMGSWNFENSTSTTIPDLSGKGFNASFSNSSISFAPGYRGYGTQSVKVNDTFVQANGLSQALKDSPAITFGGWYKYDGLPSVLSAGNTSGHFRLFQFLNNATSSGFSAYINQPDNQIKVEARSTVGGSIDTFSTGVFATEAEIGKWHYYTFVEDFVNKSSKAYIDGVLVGEKTNITAFTLNKYDVGTPTEPSARFGGSGSAIFAGAMDELRVYNYALLASDILTLSQNTRQATVVNNISIGGNDCLQGLVENADDEFGVTLNVSESLTGVVCNVANTEVFVNEVKITDLANAVFHVGDTVVVKVNGDLWETPKYYKVNIGFRKYETVKLRGYNAQNAETTIMEEGTMTFKTKVKNNDTEKEFSLISAIYDKANGSLVKVGFTTISIAQGASAEFINTIDVPINYGKYKVKAMLFDQNMAPLAVNKVYDSEDLILPSVIGSNSVIQRDEPIKVWGKAVPTTNVTVSFGGENVVTSADEMGNFTAVLPAMSVNTTGQSMTISSGSKTVTYQNILLGDVWLCGGQSNMRYSLNTTNNVSLAEDNANIRFFNQDNSANSVPQFEVQNGSWSECTVATATSFSGVGYLFGRELALKDPTVPIGLVISAWGGSTAEAWISDETIQTREDFKALDARMAPTEVRRPSHLYNSMLNPIIPSKMKGVIFYHGEANTYNATLYKDLFEALATDWRTKFGYNIPMIYAQISGYVGVDAYENLMGIRESQLNANIINSAMVVTMDVGETSIHPKEKLPVAQRMARAARGLVYGDNINYKSPTVDSVVFDGNTATITFKDIGVGLDTTQTLAEFTLFEGGTSATATTATFLGNDKIVVTGTGITSADEVRYSWSQLPTTTVWGVQSDGVKLPASPFRFTGGVQ